MAPFVDLSTKGAITRRASIEKRGWKVMAGWLSDLKGTADPNEKEREITGRAA
jgi:hypothetical protein